jgi:hypothetical protein
MEILISRKSVYGNAIYYPECEQSKLFAEIAGTKTLTRPVLHKIKRLGFTVKFKPAVEETFA